MTQRRYPLIDETANLLAYFQRELEHALDVLCLQTVEETKVYLVHMLDGFVRPDTAQRAQIGLERPAALLLGDAVHSPGEQRIDAYRQLGDTCLYHCGFFEERLVRHGLTLDYYCRIGQLAYTRLARWMGSKQPGGALELIFRDLAREFAGLARALQHVAGKAPEEHDQPEAPEHALLMFKGWSPSSC